MTIKVEINCYDNQRKITAIKYFRAAFQTDLATAKQFIEENNDKWVEIICNDDQFGRFVLICNTKCAGKIIEDDNYRYPVIQPIFNYRNPIKYSDSRYDFRFK